MFLLSLRRTTWHQIFMTVAVSSVPASTYRQHPAAVRMVSLLSVPQIFTEKTKTEEQSAQQKLAPYKDWPNDQGVRGYLCTLPSKISADCTIVDWRSRPSDFGRTCCDWGYPFVCSRRVVSNWSWLLSSRHGQGQYFQLLTLV